MSVVALVATAPAAGAQSGVTYDPDSPAGHEYEIPLQAARGDHAGSSGSSGSPSTASGADRPLFGEGISKAAGKPAGTGAKGGTSQKSSKHRGSQTAPVEGGGLPTTGARRTAVAVPEGSSMGVTGVAAVLVLLAAGALAFALRRRSA